jgi:threonine dehydratase
MELRRQRERSIIVAPSAAAEPRKTEMTEDIPELIDIREAARRIAGSIMNTPCVPSKTLSQIAGCELFLKFENLQFTASFKERGALNKLLQLGPAERQAGVCAMSAGNHAQGVAYHAKRLGIPATIFMPIGTPLTKISRTRDHVRCARARAGICFRSRCCIHPSV